MINIANPTFDVAEQEAVQEVLEGGMVADGPKVREFESAFATYCGSDHAVATANGTAALQVALEGLGIGDGDTVVTTPFSFVASANAIRLVGAEPVFADIDPATYNLDPESAREAVRATDADAILVVHLYGLPADMDAFRAIANEADVHLIEDAAQAHGASYGGQSIGTFGDAAAFSFYPTKNMTTGEGGMVLTDDPAVADRGASFANHGRTGDDVYAHKRVGHNLRMTSIAAAIGTVQLEQLEQWVRARRRHARRLTDRLEDVPGLTVPSEPAGARHSYHQYTVRTENRDQLRERLDEVGVGTGVYYPTLIPHLEAYDGYEADTPVASRAADTVLSLPVHPGLSAAEVDHVATAVREAVGPASRVS
ncbi:DegT/DnrJ/EryC1/StrS family aminotransferase [Halodesulfurarchaeum formicicum]|uniref:dTDP-4-amino-4,6-dideoxygalactose transaminase n=1 Tax=Halodesulfurarchaeum formicicum TaxID=1873524 RepID=A0A1J1AAD9_9EURY|nr:DegT/DnrJ/EryC1/StrS family aminotransferase [Halodesulfurarchaeum formicicum]APE95106.1 dTDP-4-amino-4,6-dideoxygalactose transaminase [Halodesulfurarchaeum formicicum]